MSDPFDPFQRRPQPTAGFGVNPTPGDYLGKYQLLEPLGAGGMGQAWKARHPKGHPVAIKLLPREVRGIQAAVLQVHQAYLVVQPLTHPSICKTIDMEDDIVFGPFVVLDFVPGVTLTEHVHRLRLKQGKLTVDDVVRLLRPIAEALDYAHSEPTSRLEQSAGQGVLHRDVKPDNTMVIVDKDGKFVRTVLVDFGLAAEIRRTLTQHSQGQLDTFGTPTYMSPEQLRGKRTQWDGRTDQYALAVVAYELLAGHPPFEAVVGTALREAILNEPADPIPALPQGANAALLRGLAKEREPRFEGCTQFIRALEAGGRVAPVQPVVKTAPALLVAPFDAAAAKSAQRAWSEFLGVPVETTNSLGMRFALIPPGEFAMGSTPAEIERVIQSNSAFKPEWGAWEQPRHRVRITQPSLIGCHTVTRGQFAQFVAQTGFRTDAETGKGSWVWEWGGSKLNETKTNWRTPGFGQSDDHPVVCVSWNDTQAFIKWLSQVEKREYRLPTEAIWEFACRAGTSTWHYLGEDPEQLARLGNVADAAYKKKFTDRLAIAANDGYVYTAPVGEFEPNTLGLYDLIGNVTEWCSDWFGGEYYTRSPTNDPAGPEIGCTRVRRGGSWADAASICRSASREWGSHGYWCNHLGFRLLLVR